MTTEKATGVSVIVTLVLTIVAMSFNIFGIPADQYWSGGWFIVEFCADYLTIFVVIGMPIMLWCGDEEGE